MDVAGHWQREWVGAAEYGKVIEGGVTRRVTRAMEVLNASAPGARVRVLRAAYHSSAGLGVPASSFMLHSSRRVFSSGSHFLESPESPTKPLEISSTPLNSSPDSIEEENYKVTEPDDFEISEPSKWKGSKDRMSSTVRMPSEESSSTDNASIVDLDSRTHHIKVIKRDSYDSINSDTNQNHNMRFSPLLDAPVTLSTLKYKSLLNGSNDWNNRRKSYSFEDTSPLHETILQSNDTIAMESSTDSGICKSTELVNDYSEDSKPRSKFSEYLRKDFKEKDTREHCFRGGTDFGRKSLLGNNITLQSSGKVSITLPVTVENDEYQDNEDKGRRVKKVGFSKTELHFAAESGKVNIIATDEKPPPSYDFRKRRSAFVPIHNNFEKPITLFGEKNSFSDISHTINFTNDQNEMIENDENTAATKGILKNKIPKPKPYLLGENMLFGSSIDKENGNIKGDFAKPTAVSLINKQLQSQRRHSIETTSSAPNESTEDVNKVYSRTSDKSPLRYDALKYEEGDSDVETTANARFNRETHVESPKMSERKLNILNLSPINGRMKTRQLRECDLTYFGVNNNKPEKLSNWKHTQNKSSNSETSFRSVKLIQQVSSRVETENENEEVPEYENIYIKSPYVPKPAPRSSTKYNEETNRIKESLRPIVQSDKNDTHFRNESRRPRLRRHEISSSPTISNRSISEPPKTTERSFRSSPERQGHHRLRNVVRSKKSDELGNTLLKKKINVERSQDIQAPIIPYYTDIIEENTNQAVLKDSSCDKSIERHRSRNVDDNIRKISKSPTENNKGNLKSRESRQNESKEARRRQITDNKPKIPGERPSSDRENTFDKKITSVDRLTSIKTNTGSVPRENKRNQLRKTHQKENKSPDRINHIKTIISETSTNNIKDVKTNNAVIEQTSTKRESKRQQDKNIHHHIRTASPQKNKNRIDKDDRNRNVRTTSQSSNRSEYVINYDDKNGTVSSIHKIKPGIASSRRKKTNQEKIKEDGIDKKAKHETSSKSVRK